ncbi:MAG: hypothetical protein EHM91_01090 [Planctomycetota bacterium]|nr:MAG: hypothetical protein EHM91_01090 [Planctomycetota bacterium]
MTHDELDPKGRKAHDSIPSASIPGDPFPWAPDLSGRRPLEPGDTADGSTRSPAEPGDIASFDLGGGD